MTLQYAKQLTVIALFASGIVAAQQTANSIRPGEQWLDDRGRLIQAHGGGIIRLKDAGVTPTEIAVRLGIGRASVYRILGSSGGENRQKAA